MTRELCISVEDLRRAVKANLTSAHACAAARFRRLHWVNRAAGLRRPPKVIFLGRRPTHAPGLFR